MVSKTQIEYDAKKRFEELWNQQSWLERVFRNKVFANIWFLHGNNEQAIYNHKLWKDHNERMQKLARITERIPMFRHQESQEHQNNTHNQSQTRPVGNQLPNTPKEHEHNVARQKPRKKSTPRNQTIRKKTIQQ